MNHPYTLKKNSRSKNIRLSVYRNGEVVVTAPPYADISIVEQFLRDKAEWIEHQLLKFFLHRERHPIRTISLTKHTKEEIAQYSVQAERIVHERLQHFNLQYGFLYKKISIKNQKSRWGSCSSKGNLQFNYKIALLPPELQDYIVVHELCHLGEFNHSARFWALVERTIPQYREYRKKLRSGV